MFSRSHATKLGRVIRNPLPPPSAPALAGAPRSSSSNGVTSLTVAALPPCACATFLSDAQVPTACPLPWARRSGLGHAQPGACPEPVLRSVDSHRRGTLRVPTGRPSHVIGINATSPDYGFRRAWHLDPDPPTFRETSAPLVIGSSHARHRSIPWMGDRSREGGEKPTEAAEGPSQNGHGRRLTANLRRAASSFGNVAQLPDPHCFLAQLGFRGRTTAPHRETHSLVLADHPVDEAILHGLLSGEVPVAF